MWHRIHIDYAGPFEGRIILIIFKAHSKYIDAHVMSAATTSATLTKLRQTFAMLGLPSTVVTEAFSVVRSLNSFVELTESNTSSLLLITHPAMAWLNAPFRQ